MCFFRFVPNRLVLIRVITERGRVKGFKTESTVAPQNGDLSPEKLKKNESGVLYKYFVILKCIRKKENVSMHSLYNR